MHPISRTVTAIAFISIAGACGGYSGTSSAPSTLRHDLNVEVRNHNFYDATVYAYHRGERLRLGMAQGKSTSTFAFQWDLGDLRFIVDFVGAGELVGELMPVYSGDQLILIVGSEDHRRAKHTEDSSAEDAGT